VFDDQLLDTPPPRPASTEPHRALYLRFRPKRFEDVVGQEHVTRTLKNAVKAGRPSHAYLFTGPRGTGKTSVARILYRAANCEHLDDGDPCNVCSLCRSALEGRALDLVEIDAASNRSIDDVRDLREKIAYHPGEGRYRVYIIDEAHELTPQAWDALLKTLEEPPPHAMFVLATTEAHKVPSTIVSRCQRFDFRRIPFQPTRELLQRVASAEGMEIEPAVLERLALVARGGLRDALSLLDQLEAYAGGRIDMEVARAALSLPSIEAVRGAVDGMSRRDPATVMGLLSDAAEGGADLRLLAEELVVYLRALLLLVARADGRLTDELPADEVEWLRQRAPAWSFLALSTLIQTLSDALARTRDAQQFQVQTEVALLTACDVQTLASAAPESRPPVGSASTPTTASTSADAATISTAPRAHNTRTSTMVDRSADRTSEGQSSSSPGAEATVATPSEPQPVALAASDQVFARRWLDVVDHVRARNPMLAALLRSAQPLRLEDNVLVVGFASDFNRKSADRQANRQIIETAFDRVYGTPYRLRSTVRTESEGDSLLDDPVINYATRTFGGQPRRVAATEEEQELR
jgi:DNA polymerase-3 subunit gamma/tau